MKTFTLPGTDIVAPNVVLGLMRIAEKTDDADPRRSCSTGLRRRHHFFDHADIYGGELHGCESPVRRGPAADPVAARRDHPPDQGGHRARRAVLRLLLRAHPRVGRRLAAGAAHRPHRHPAAAPPRRPGRTRRGRPRVRRARRRRQGPRLRRLEPHARPDRAAAPLRPPADRRQPAAAVDHARADRRAGRRRQHGRPRTSRSRATAAASSTTAACTTSPSRRGRRSRPGSSPACSWATRTTPS